MWLGPSMLDGFILCSDCCTLGTFVSLALNLRKKKDGAGISLQSLGTVVGARCLHLVSHFLRLHYVPAMIPWLLYPCMDVVNAIAGCALLAIFVKQYWSTYEKEKDDFGIHVFEKLEILPKTGPLSKGPGVAACFLYACMVVLALLWYCVRRSSHSFAVSYFCCFYEVMGAVALIPQLWMFQKDKRVSPLLANFVVLTALNRFCTLLFWIAYPRVYIWRYPDNRGIQMASETLNLLILSDFLFYWVRSKMRGDKEIIIGDPDV